MKKYLTKSRILALVIVLTLICGTAVTATGAKKVKSKSVELDVSSVTLSIGDVATLDATMKPINTTDSLKWSSSKTKVATVNKEGTVTAKAEGTATITVKTSSKKTAKCKVTVKKYLTKKEVQTLIASNLLTEEVIKTLITKQSLSEEDVVALIQEKSLSTEAVTALINSNVISETKIIELIKANSLSENAVKSLIINNTLSEEAILELVKGNTLSQETLISLIKQNSLSESEVLSLIQKNTLSEAAILELIMANTLSEDDVKAIIADNSSDNSSGGWEDGAILKIYEKQTLPYSKECENSYSETKGTVVIENCNIKKYHYDDFNENGIFYKYNYECEIKGKIKNLVVTDKTEDVNLVVAVKVFNESERDIFDQLDINITDINEDGTFTLQQQMYSDVSFDEFAIAYIIFYAEG